MLISDWSSDVCSSDLAVNEAPDTLTVGVFGKWKYVAAQDIFIGVNDNSNGDVWVYKHDDWQPVNSLHALNVATLDATTLDATALDMTAEKQSLKATDDNSTEEQTSEPPSPMSI